MLSIFGVSFVLYFIKILSGNITLVTQFSQNSNTDLLEQDCHKVEQWRIQGKSK